MNNPATVKILFFGLIVIAVALEIFADILFKKWAVENKSLLLILGLGLYFIGTMFWAVSLKFEYLAKAISVFTLFNLIIITLVGILIFKESLSLVNKIGIALGILSLILIEI